MTVENYGFGVGLFHFPFAIRSSNPYLVEARATLQNQERSDCCHLNGKVL